MKHAFLIIAHKNCQQLIKLLRYLDHIDNEIFIHIDKKSKSISKDKLADICEKSKVHIYKEISVYWGGDTLIECELLLMKNAQNTGHHDYYHLLSGMDLPIKRLKYIHEFFEINNGKEFIELKEADPSTAFGKMIIRRVDLFHFNFFKSNHTLSDSVRKMFLIPQLVFHIHRVKRKTVFYGSEWFSISQKCIDYVIAHEEEIKETYKYTGCGDEVFLQSLIGNAPNGTLCMSENGNMRLVKWDGNINKSNPVILKSTDWKLIESSECLFARKFDEKIDSEIIDRIYTSIGS